jgi:hypothetical protein
MYMQLMVSSVLKGFAWKGNSLTKINPLPLLFKALLRGQKDCVFFSRHLIDIQKQESFRAFRLAWDI